MKMTGKKAARTKIYDGTTLLTDTSNDYAAVAETDMSSATMDETTEADFLEALVQEGDHDALLIADFEAAAQETVQEDSELATAFLSLSAGETPPWRKVSQPWVLSSQAIFLERARDMVESLQGKANSMTIAPGRLCRIVSCLLHAASVASEDTGKLNVHLGTKEVPTQRRPMLQHRPQR